MCLLINVLFCTIFVEIPSRPSESQIYEEELNRARRHLDEVSVRQK